MPTPYLGRKHKTKSEKIKDIILSLIVIILSSSVMSLVLVIMLTPLGLYGGGVTGVAQVLLHALELIFNLEWDALLKYLGILNFLFLLPFNILAYFKLSKKYGLYTFLSSVVQSVVMSLVEPLSTIKLFYESGSYNVLANVVFASILLGIANGLMMRRGATSGGIIVLCQYLNLKKDKSVGELNTIICTIIVCFGAVFEWIHGSSFNSGLSIALYTVLCYVLQSVILDYVHTSYNKVKLEVVTEHGSEIAQELVKQFNHGITINKAIGAYTQREKEVLNIVIQKYECNKYLGIIKSIDNDAFISITPIWRLTGRFNINIIDK